jgi:hypothetical protein
VDEKAKRDARDNKMIKKAIKSVPCPRVNVYLGAERGHATDRQIAEVCRYDPEFFGRSKELKVLAESATTSVDVHPCPVTFLQARKAAD